MPEATTLGAALAAVRARLELAGVGEAGIAARRLVEAATGASTLDFLVAPQTPLDAQTVVALDALVARRIAGQPVHRILGRREFHGLDLALNAETLEPRDDTEALVDLALSAVGPDRRRPVSILDLGVGTGAIALALLSELPNARALGVDVADGAVAAARTNAEAAGLAGRFAAIRSVWFEAVTGRFDLIVSNPPYIRSGDIAGLAREVREHDPPLALDGGADGLDAYREIAQTAAAHLTSGGAVAVEIGFDQRADVEAIFIDSGFAAAGSARDLAGHDRALCFRPRK